MVKTYDIDPPDSELGSVRLSMLRKRKDSPQRLQDKERERPDGTRKARRSDNQTAKVPLQELRVHMDGRVQDDRRQ